MTSGPVCCHLAIVLASYCTDTAAWFHPHDIVSLLALGRTLRHARFQTAPKLSLLSVHLPCISCGRSGYVGHLQQRLLQLPDRRLGSGCAGTGHAGPRDAPWKAVAGQCGLLLSTVVLFCISAFASVYGETSNPLTTPADPAQGRRVRRAVDHDDQAAFITAATAVLGKQVGRGKRLRRHGRPPATSADGGVAMTLSTWTSGSSTGSLPPSGERR